MIESSTPKNTLQTTAAYAGAAALCLLIYALLTRLKNADLTVPFGFHSDGFVILVYIKGMIENGWYLHNPHVGIPGGFDMSDYPISDGLHLLIMKLMSLFITDCAVIFNLYYILTYPLTTLTSLFVLRRFQIRFPIALLASLLFAFLPYHFMRGPNHLFLASYFMVPPMVMVILWVYMGYPCLVRCEDERSKPNLCLRTSESILGSAICFLVGSAGIYYAFFGCFFLLIAALSSCLARRRIYPLAVAGFLIVLVSLGVLTSIFPSILYNYRHGSNPEVFTRLPSEAETFGMKIILLLVPIMGHRVPLLAQLNAKYMNGFTPLITENCIASLGILGSIGFLVLIGRLLYRRNAAKGIQLLDGLSTLNIFAVLLATIGGFGAVFSYYIYQMIRAYNRISIYIAFFALFTVVLILQAIYNKYVKSSRSRFIFYVVLGILLAGGVLDQTSSGYVPAYRMVKAEYRSDADFVRRIEASVPENAMIFQLPYHAFPECVTSHDMRDYDHFRVYLHSQTLRWSYGVMKGREGDLWQRSMAARPVKEMAQKLAFAGFSGIYVDRYAFADRGTALEDELTGLLGGEPLVSSNQRFAFFNMADYNKSLRESCSVEEWSRQEELAWHPILFKWQGGFYTHWEGTWQGCYAGSKDAETGHWRWCRSEGELLVINLSNRIQEVEITMSVFTLWEEMSNLWIEGSLLDVHRRINKDPRVLTGILRVPPGKHALRFTCDARKPQLPNDPRELVLRVLNFSSRECE